MAAEVRADQDSRKIRWMAAAMGAIELAVAAAVPLGLVAAQVPVVLFRAAVLLAAAGVSARTRGWTRRAADAAALLTALTWMFTVVAQEAGASGGLVPLLIGTVGLCFLLVLPPGWAALLTGALAAAHSAVLTAAGTWTLEWALNGFFVELLAWFWFRETWKGRRLADRNQAMVAELQELNRRWNALALQDPLTVIPNRRSFDQAVSQLWEDPAAAGQPVALLLGDIDWFKAVNDRWGHPVGDELLRWVAQRLGARLRPPGFLARVGGEEFAVLLPGTGADDARSVAERLRTSLGPPGLPGLPAELTISMSWGVAAGVPGRISPEDWYRQADEALYRAKANGRNRVEVS